MPLGCRISSMDISGLSIRYLQFVHTLGHCEQQDQWHLGLNLRLFQNLLEQNLRDQRHKTGDAPRPRPSIWALLPVLGNLLKESKRVALGSCAEMAKVSLLPRIRFPPLSLLRRVKGQGDRGFAGQRQRISGKSWKADNPLITPRFRPHQHCRKPFQNTEFWPPTAVGDADQAWSSIERILFLSWQA